MKRIKITKEILERMYHGDQLTDKEIAHELGYNISTICSYRKKFNIKGINAQHRKFLQNPEPKISDRQISILMGSLMGDGTIKGRSKNRRYFSLSHSSKQKAYIQWLYEELKNLCPSNPSPYVSKKGYVTYTLRTSSRMEFYHWRERIYTPYKKINEWWLSFMNPLAIAIWYMDDGSLNYKNKHKSYFSFATNCFSIKENYLLKNHLQFKYDIKSEVKQIKRPNDKYQCNLLIHDDSFGAFINLVESYIPDCMGYKLPSSQRKFILSSNIKCNINKDTLKEMYYDKKLTQSQIASELGVHRYTISKYMNLFGIKVRNNKQAQLAGANSKNVRGKDGRFYSRDNTIEEVERAKIIFKKLRKTSFPYPRIKESESYVSIIEHLFLNDCLKINDKEFKYSSSGMKVISDLCPQIFDMATNNSLTPLQIFNDDEKLMDCIFRTLKYAKKDTISAIRSGLKTYKNNRCVSNFPPLWAKAVLKEYCTAKNLTMLDFSCGFGGRMLGSYASSVVRYYIGIDPLTENINSNFRIYDLIKKHSSLNNKEFNCKLINETAEKGLNIIDENVDIILTSPPYFNKEIYSDDKSQCYNFYSDYLDWKDKWLKDVIHKSFNLLNHNGIMAIFIGNVNTHDIVTDCNNIMSEFGDTQKIFFQIPHVEYNRKKKEKKKDTCIVLKKI